MLSTLKSRIIAGAAALVVVGGGITAAVIANSDNDDSSSVKHKKNKEESSLSVIDSDDDTDHEEEEEEEAATTTAPNEASAEETTTTTTALASAQQEDTAFTPAVLDASGGGFLNYYALSKDWGDAKSSIEGFLYTESRPVTTEELNRLYTPFTDNDDTSIEYVRIEEYLESKTIAPDESASVMLGLDGQGFNISSALFTVYNYSDAPLSGQECFDNDWWALRDPSGGFQNAALGITNPYDLAEDPYDEGSYRYSDEALDVIFERFGKPDYFIFNKSYNVSAPSNVDDLVSIYKNEADSVYAYNTAVFIYDDYVATVDIIEDILIDEDHHILDKLRANLYTKAAWEKHFDSFDKYQRNLMYVIKYGDEDPLADWNKESTEP